MPASASFFLRCACLLFVGLWGLSVGGASVSAQTRMLRWHTDLDRAAELARETGKPLFVVFRCVR